MYIMWCSSSGHVFKNHFWDWCHFYHVKNWHLKSISTIKLIHDFLTLHHINTAMNLCLDLGYMSGSIETCNMTSDPTNFLQ